MQAFLQSAFLRALAYSLIASIWQMALLWLATVLLLKLFELSSAQKFNISFTAQLSGFILFIITCVTAYNTGTGKIIIDAANPDFISGINTFTTAIMPYAAILYLAMLMFKLAKLVLIFNDTQQLKKRNLKKMPAEQRIFVQRVAELFSLHRKVKIYLSEKVICPLTTGFFKPVILIPVAAINYLTTEQMEAVILHELAHIKRADYILYILQSMIERIFFFNIFSTMMSEIIERERENACDDWVLQFRYNSMHYAEALFKLGRLKAVPALAMPLQGKKESLLLMRIKRLLHNPQSSSYNFQSVLLGLASVLITAGLLIVPASKPAKQFVGINGNLVNVARGNSNKNIYTVGEKKPAIIIAKQLKKQPVQIKIAKIAPLANFHSEVKEVALNNREANLLQLKQNYVYKVRQSLDSLKQSLSEYNHAVDAKVEVTPEMYQKAISYQNFKQLEAMLTASSDSINVRENEFTKDSYRKLITIESFDKNGDKHIYNVIVELYQ